MVWHLCWAYLSLPLAVVTSSQSAISSLDTAPLATVALPTLLTIALLGLVVRPERAKQVLRTRAAPPVTRRALLVKPAKPAKLVKLVRLAVRLALAANAALGPLAPQARPVKLALRVAPQVLLARLEPVRPALLDLVVSGVQPPVLQVLVVQVRLALLDLVAAEAQPLVLLARLEPVRLALLVILAVRPARVAAVGNLQSAGTAPSRPAKAAKAAISTARHVPRSMVPAGLAISPVWGAIRSLLHASLLRPPASGAK
ncbi:hypothetical protein IT412_03250 [Candidatus Peregrinibacteria bacterium]|nr:hypothetical protein [Candidatus Peregrinibacteria bacterium]